MRMELGTQSLTRSSRLGAAAAIVALGLSLQPSGGGIARAQGNPTAQRMVLPAVNGSSRNFFKLPMLTPRQAHAGVPRALPLLPLGRHVAMPSPGATAPSGRFEPSGSAPTILTKFNGMEDSPAICAYFGGCQPSDMGLATTPYYVFQGVNSSRALYSKNGSLLQEVNDQQFFGVPNPQPAGCDPNGPFLSDPRAFYDPNDGLIWTADLQIEGAFGIAPQCNFLSKTWVAVLDPVSGSMHVYSFDTTLGTSNGNDYTELGFNATSVEFSMNMFNQQGTAYEYAETFSLDKHAMEAGRSVTPVVFYNYMANGVAVDTVQPVETETTVPNDPTVEYLVNSFNMNGDGTNDCFTTPCSGFVQWTISNPGSKSASIAGTVVPSSQTYISPPNADQPGCSQCIETIDTRITGTPVYSLSTGTPLITFGLGTAVNNRTQVVPGILWGQIQPVTSTLYQAGYFYFQGDRDASFPAFMPDSSGTLYMVFDTMSSTLNPSIMVASRGPRAKLGTFGAPVFVQKGLYPTCDSRWGDYEAASYDGFSTNHVWIASQYSGAPNQVCPSGGDWATTIAQIN